MNNSLSLFILFIFFSCAKERMTPALIKPAGCDSTAFSFNKDILPILNANCNFALCHATSGRAGYDYTNYHTFINQVRSGNVDYRLDLPFNDPQHMPEKMHLSQCDYFIIKAWIRQGFPED